MPLTSMKPPVIYQSRLNVPAVSKAKDPIVESVAMIWNTTSLRTCETSFCVTETWRIKDTSTMGTVMKTTR